MSFIGTLLRSSWATRFCDWLDRNYGVILMFHRINNLKPGGLKYNQHLKVPPEYFNEMILNFKKNGFTFLSLDNMLQQLDRCRPIERFAVITFDDGYRDVLHNAIPILNAHQIPATVFIATGFLDREFWPWWDVLEDLIVTFKKNLSQIQMEELFLTVRSELLNLDYPQIKRRLQQLVPDIDITSLIVSCSEQFINYAELSKLAQEPLVTIGCHTHSHQSCGELNTATWKDIDKSLTILRDKYRLPVKHFAFPFGDFRCIPDKKQCQLLADRGFKCALTTNPGVISRYDHQSRYFLPRIFINPWGETGTVLSKKYAHETRIAGLKRRFLEMRKWNTK